MKKFILKILFFSLPFWLLFILYFILDPFKVIYSYESYFDTQVNGTVFLNTDYIATTNFENKYNRYHYTSFIFGNSRAWFYRVSDWQKMIGDEPAYHFDAAGETIYALHKKVMYLDKKDVELKNALLILDPDILSEVEPKSGHLGVISPQLVDYRNWIDFHIASITGFMNIQFLYAYLDFKLTGKLKPYMQRNHLIESRPFRYNPVTNEISFNFYEKMIRENQYYTEKKRKEFYERASTEEYLPPRIEEPQEKMLREIAHVFEKHNTNVKVIISPLYDQKHMAKEDVLQLATIFGSSVVFDFSGKNSITENYINYYETSHYRPVVAGKLIQRVYKNEQKGQSKRITTTGLSNF